MRRTIRILVLVGTPLLAIGLILLDFSAASSPIFDCWGLCESTLATALAGHPIPDIPLAILSAVPMAVAWILCLIQLVRMGRRSVAAALAIALPLLAALALSRFYATTDGTWLPNAAATSTFAHSLALLLLWPVAPLWPLSPYGRAEWWSGAGVTGCSCSQQIAMARACMSCWTWSS